MPRLRNPYGYTIVENAHKQNHAKWNNEEPEWELPSGIRKRTTKERGEFYTASHNTLLKAAAKEAARTTGLTEEDVINAVAAYKNVAVALLGLGVDVDLLGMIKVKSLVEPTRTATQQSDPLQKRISTQVEPWLSGYMRLSEERVDLMFTPWNWYELLFEHGSHIRKTPGEKYKQKDKELEGGYRKEGQRTYEQALADLKAGAPVPPSKLAKQKQEERQGRLGN
jgi:hypothetical protein